MQNPAPAADDRLQPGFMAIHGNRLEDLRDLATRWLAHAPLAVLEDEVVLVQSNGIAQWFKQALARPLGEGGLGISAAVDVQLPGRFLWSAYRAVLGDAVIESQSPFDPERLVWRLLRLLPGLVDRDGFAPLRQYLGDDADGRKRHQLALRLADLYDQYQVHRADWLLDWEHRRDVLSDPLRGRVEALPAEQRWQAELWRCLLDDVGPSRRREHRAAVHRQFVARCGELDQRPAGMPRRVVVFGISSLPQQTLEALAALSRHCQVLLVVMNPCRQYWADIVEDRELLRAERRRHGSAVAVAVDLPGRDGHPLLAAWGRQGRDYIRLLDQFDVPDSYRRRFGPLGDRIDLYDDPGESTVLRQLQHDILDLVPLDPAKPRQLAGDDPSLRFHLAHSPQREVEILHDRLLALRDAADAAGTPLQPRDVLVMVPDIQTYAPHIEAVFGGHATGDPRQLPFSITDRPARGRATVLVALEFLVGLPDAACTVSDVVGILEAPALRRRFGIDDGDLPVLRRWIHQSGVRWGLHREQRERLGLADNDQNSWAFGLRRMLLGYAVGDGDSWHGIAPHGEVGGLDARLVGALALLLERIDQWWRMLATEHTAADWTRLLRQLLADAFDAGDDADDALRLERLNDSLDEWTLACTDAALVETLPRAIVCETWLASVDQPRLSQRFGSGTINFATLMPMRAIPFRVVCLLGMNDGDYPRSRPALDFDLMARHGSQRPGDRSRRDDDRYLFLEALLSVRDHLHLSWVGRSARDNDPRPPSVLLGQLRDHLAAGWRVAGSDDGNATLAALTVAHPLQPFGRDGFDASQPQKLGYGREWRDALCATAPTDNERQPLHDPVERAPIGLARLRGLLRHPVQQFFNSRLNVFLDGADDAVDDHEPFAVIGLERWKLADGLLRDALQAADGDADAAIERAVQRIHGSGQLPLHAMALEPLQRLAEQTRDIERRWRDECVRWPRPLPPREVRVSHAGVVLEDWLVGLRSDADGHVVRLHAFADALLFGKGTPKPKWHRLLGAWVEHLAAHADGPAVETRILASDCRLVLAPLSGVEAKAQLQLLLETWRSGMNAPLALSCLAGFAWLEAARAQASGKDVEPGIAAEAAFDGERNEDPYLARVWTDFASLRDHGFEDELAVYSGLFDRLRIDGTRP